MSMYQKSETAKISVTSTAGYATFATGVRKVYITCDADCYISFDENVPVLSTSFLVKANQHPAEFDFGDGGPVKVWAITSSSANLYILVIR